MGRPGLLSILLVVGSFTAGCSEVEYIPVEGKVNFNGNPLNSGVVMFQPKYGPPARGDIRSDGTFVLETPGRATGARIGQNLVRISSREPSRTDGGEIALGKLLIPKKYTQFATSGLTAEVDQTNSEPFLFELTE